MNMSAEDAVRLSLGPLDSLIAEEQSALAKAQQEVASHNQRLQSLSLLKAGVTGMLNEIDAQRQKEKESADA